jgi:hypothetical protein
MNHNLKNGTTLTGLGLKLTLEDTELLTEAGSCGADEWLYHWLTQDDKYYLTTNIELAGLLADGAELTE